MQLCVLKFCEILASPLSNSWSHYKYSAEFSYVDTDTDVSEVYNISY